MRVESKEKKLSKAWVKGLKSSTWRLDKEKEIEIKRERKVFEEEKMEENTKKYKKMEKGVGFCKARSLVNLVVIRLSTQWSLVEPQWKNLVN